MDSVIRTRINSDLKEKATAILEDCGLNMSTALRLFVEQVVINEGLPFDVSRKPSPRLLQAMREAEEINRDDTSRYANVEEMVDSLDNGKT